jgi:2-polyprenyl-3-methyl-5-hydroxy-6-metoxy-1,4-benzoquinol methylase
MGVPSARITNLQRARLIAVRTRKQVLALGVGSGMRRYRPQRSSVQSWERAYTSGGWDFLSDLYELPRYSLLIGYLRKYPGTPTVLDIGCGTGLLRELLADEDFSTYSGIDLSAEAIKRAAPLIDGRTSFTVGDAMTIDLPSADVVLLNEMLYYSPSPGALLERVASTVRPGGLVLTSIYRHGGDRALWRLLDNKLVLVSACRGRVEYHPYSRRGFRVSCHRIPGRSA